MSILESIDNTRQSNYCHSGSRSIDSHSRACTVFVMILNMRETDRERRGLMIFVTIIVLMKRGFRGIWAEEMKNRIHHRNTYRVFPFTTIDNERRNEFETTGWFEGALSTTRTLVYHHMKECQALQRTFRYNKIHLEHTQVANLLLTPPISAVKKTNCL
jgi:hypothetical protein